jgi:hypothetical protein
MPRSEAPALTSVESGTAADGIVPYWNNSSAPVPPAAAPQGFRAIRGYTLVIRCAHR